MYEQYVLIWRLYLPLLHSRPLLLDGSMQKFFFEPVVVVQIIELQKIAEHYWMA